MYIHSQIYIFSAVKQNILKKQGIYGITIPIFNDKSLIFFSNNKKYVVKGLSALQTRAEGDKNTYFVAKIPLFRVFFGFVDK